MRLVFFSLFLSIIFACVKSGTEPEVKTPKTCPEIRDSTFPTSIAEPQYGVITPNGGETFRIGQKLKVILTAKDDSEAIAYITLRTGGTRHKIILPEAPRGKFNPSAQCDLSFTIPDSINTGLDKKISLVSDSVKIFVAKYNSEATYFDYSDAYFKILP